MTGDATGLGVMNLNSSNWSNLSFLNIEEATSISFDLRPN